MKIGVFDSGIGGKIVADELQLAFTDDEILYAHDREHVPYGNKSPEEIQQLTLLAITPLINAGCTVIVIACNTASTNAISFLRKTHPRIFFIGLEPMIKPAATQTKSGVIAVCATRATLASESYAILKEMWAKDVRVIEPDCHEWASVIENNRSEEIEVAALVADLRKKRCDVIVLGCTHYHWLKKRFQNANQNMIILEPTDAIRQRIDHFKQDYSSFTAATN
ncbi:MAG TPA: aspartate/glutamate racemase family protein [Candidatus Saccharimonadales bacterium]|nr:aspartate/glutamate racemase family protein [Candidatus Saccharimonadales bacterium]